MDISNHHHLLRHSCSSQATAFGRPSPQANNSMGYVGIFARAVSNPGPPDYSFDYAFYHSAIWQIAEQSGSKRHNIYAVIGSARRRPGGSAFPTRRQKGPEQRGLNLRVRRPSAARPGAGRAPRAVPWSGDVVSSFHHCRFVILYYIGLRYAAPRTSKRRWRRSRRSESST